MALKQSPLTIPKFRQKKNSSNKYKHELITVVFFFPQKTIIKLFVIAEVHELFLEILPNHENQHTYFSCLNLRANTGKVMEFIINTG